MRNLHKGKGYSWKTYLSRYWTLYLLLLLPIAFFILFRYTPMTYILQAFKKNNILVPPWKVEWAKNNGMQWFLKAFKDKDFIVALKNTIFLNLLDLLIGMPMPIIMALLLNELAFPKYKRITQTVLYRKPVAGLYPAGCGRRQKAGCEPVSRCGSLCHACHSSIQN